MLYLKVFLCFFFLWKLSKVVPFILLITFYSCNFTKQNKKKLDAVIKTVIPARKCLTLNIYLRI